MRFLVLAAACALIAGCVYRIEVQQGNYVTQDAVAKLKTGMTKTEVRQALGTPLLADVFHADRWDFYFSQVRGPKAEEGKLCSVYFKDDKLVSFTGTVHPPAPPPVGAPPPPRPNVAK
jgi:outer membrane protein assembly factor BamE